MSIYDYIIVGGGISGLFMAHKLSITGSKILVVESSNRLGGRLFTDKQSDCQFELGGARISSKHTKVMSLLKELSMKDDLIQLPETIHYKIKGPKINFYSLVKELYEGSKLYSKRYKQNVNLLQICIDVLGNQHAKLLQSMLGYDSEFIHLNAYQALSIFKKDLFSPSSYFVLKGGFTSLINKLEEGLRSKSNVSILMDTSVSDVGKNYIQINKHKKYGTRIICCIPVQAIQRLPKFSSLSELDRIEPIPLIRIYAKYPKDKSGKVWFHKLKRTITDNYIRHVIPIDYDKGLIMISYTDGDYANMWRNLSNLGTSILVKHLHKEIKNLFSIEPPKPEFVRSHYWSGGVHMWKPGSNTKEIYETLMKPFENEKIYLVNEAYSLHQSWVEGSLDMCYDVLTLLNKSFKRSIQTKGGGKRVKQYTINQVLKKRNWIVMDLRGKLRIYDVSKWLQDHPGGRDNLKRGIKANKHYKYPKKYPEAPIQLFKQIGAHKSGNVIQTMLFKENPKVKFIGIMRKV